MGLRKFKSDKDLRGKLRKARASEEGSRAVISVASHQRVPSIPPVLPLPVHIAQSIAITSASSSSSSKSVQSFGTSSTSSTARPSIRSTTAKNFHRRSRSFSTLTSMLSPASSTFDQPWRSREKWLAIHSRTPSPPPTAALPSAAGGTDGGWRRKGNGGFFARELAGVGDTTLSVPVPSIIPGFGSGRSRTMNDLAGELERPVPTRQISEPIVEPVDLHTASKSQGIRVEVEEWKPGFATFLYRQKTRRASLKDTPHTPPVEEVITPPPPSRPESRTLPESSSPQVSRRDRSDTNTSSSVIRAATISRVDSTRTNTTSESTCYMTVSVRTSQSSSLHTYENDEAEMYASGLAKEPVDVPESPDASPLVPASGRLPIIVTPTATHYHFGSIHSVNGRPVYKGPARKRQQIKEETYLPYLYKSHDPAPRSYDRHAPAHQIPSRNPQFKHTRDESLPPLLPPTPIERSRPSLTDPNSPRIGRMRNLPWTQASQQGDKSKLYAGSTPIALTGKRDATVPRRNMGAVREVSEERDVPLVPNLRGSRSSEMGRGERWSKGSIRSRESEPRRGGWV